MALFVHLPSSIMPHAALSAGAKFRASLRHNPNPGVNKPELLPEEFTPLIDVAGFLSDGQEKRLKHKITALEKDTGFKLRAIVFVADPTFENILNFNVGASVNLDIPPCFWSRLAGKYGNIFYWKEKGEDQSIEAAVMAISNAYENQWDQTIAQSSAVATLHPGDSVLITCVCWVVSNIVGKICFNEKHCFD
ncbi:hypothetical protein LIER_18523 [Lithospermum erythrorhizon]|uniref:Uncharacterized protein n=1 Tax=Lithospermum erythrorhizon TaxID=34254 RepID=A0AAV3QEA6_LITER